MLLQDADGLGRSYYAMTKCLERYTHTHTPKTMLWCVWRAFCVSGLLNLKLPHISSFHSLSLTLYTSLSEGNVEETVQYLEMLADISHSHGLEHNLPDAYLCLGNIYYAKVWRHLWSMSTICIMQNWNSTCFTDIMWCEFRSTRLISILTHKYLPQVSLLMSLVLEHEGVVWLYCISNWEDLFWICFCGGVFRRGGGVRYGSVNYVLLYVIFLIDFPLSLLFWVMFIDEFFLSKTCLCLSRVTLTKPASTSCRHIILPVI